MSYFYIILFVYYIVRRHQDLIILNYIPWVHFYSCMKRFESYFLIFFHISNINFWFLTWLGHEWIFHSDNLVALCDKLNFGDKAVFNIDVSSRSIDWELYWVRWSLFLFLFVLDLSSFRIVLIFYRLLSSKVWTNFWWKIFQKKMSIG